MEEQFSVGVEEQFRVWVEVELRDKKNVAQIPWQSVDTNSDATINPLPFTEPVGLSSLLPVGSAPFDYYSQIIDRDVVDILVQETNK